MTDIAIDQNDGFAQQIATGGQTIFDFDFPIFDESHIQVLRTRAGVLTELDLTTDYTVPGASVNDEDGGTIVLTSGATADDIITMRLNVPEERTSDFQTAGDFFAIVLNEEFDLQTQMIQQLRRDLNRAARLADDSALTSVVLPTPEDGAAILWDGTSGAMQNGPTADEIEDAQNWAIKTDGAVSGGEYSAKAYAIGGTGVTTTSGKGSAKDWATKTDAKVDTSDYSAKEWAKGTQTRGAASGGSAKDWANYTGGTVDNSEYSAKKYATDSQTYASSASGYNDSAAASAAAAAASASGMKWRPSVRVATTANITLSGAQTIDGVSVVAGDRVLVKDQSTASQNGVYVCASGAWTRATDADSWSELVSQVVSIEEGTANADYTYICTVNSGGTIDSTSVTWGTFKVVPAAASITNAMLATMAANTVKVNNTASSATPSDIAMSASTNLARLASGNIVAATVAQILTLLGAYSKVKVGGFTRDISTATGSQAVTGVGFTPKLLLVFGAINNSVTFSAGFTDGTTSGSINSNAGNTAGNFQAGTQFIRVIDAGSGGGSQSAAFTSFDADGFTLAWTKAGSPTGTLTCEYLAIG